MIAFTIQGEPVAKGRPRVTRWGTYTPEKTVNYETLVKHIYITEVKKEMLEGQLEIKVNAYFTIPKSASKKAIVEMENGNVRPLKRPDLDNVYKAITDSLNGLAYKDDSQIVQATISKFYSNTPRVEVIIENIA